MVQTRDFEGSDPNLAVLSNSTAMPVNNAVPSPRAEGWPTSSKAPQQLQLPSPSSWAPSKSQCRSCQWESETSLQCLLPCEHGRTNGACRKERQFDMDCTSDFIQGCVDQILEAIGEFREIYQAMEYVNASNIPRKLKKQVLQKIAKMNKENEERLQKFVAEQQVLVANISQDKHQRLQKFVPKQEEEEEGLQKFIEEQRVQMAKIIADAMKASVSVKGAAHESET